MKTKEEILYEYMGILIFKNIVLTIMKTFIYCVMLQRYNYLRITRVLKSIEDAEFEASCKNAFKSFNQK